MEQDKKALKEKRKQERKELRRARKLEHQRYIEETTDENPLKFKEWFSLKGIREELTKVHWPHGKELAVDSAVVLAFTIVLGIYFYASDAIIALILRALGMN